MMKNLTTDNIEPLKQALTNLDKKENGNRRTAIVNEVKRLIAGLRVAIEEIEEGTLEGGNDTRKIYEELSRASHVFIGLEAALTWLAEVFGGKKEMNVTLTIEGGRKHVDHCIGYFIFQCVQRLLEGALAHREGGDFEVILEDEADRIAVTVAERTFDYNGTKEEYGDRFGFTHLFERVYALGGEVRVFARSGEGTKVTVAVPPVLKKH